MAELHKEEGLLGSVWDNVTIHNREEGFQWPVSAGMDGDGARVKGSSAAGVAELTDG